MKWLLIILLTMHWAYTSAQYKKVPDFNNERNKVNDQIRKGGYHGFKVIELELAPNDTHFDTTTLSDYTYYPSGLIKEASFYNYLKRDEDIDSAYRKRLNIFSDAQTTEYNYDAAGNMISEIEYIVEPANSFSALVSLMVIYTRDNGHQPAPNFIDSMLTVGIPERRILSLSQEFIYNSDGNPVLVNDLKTGETTRYSYQYDDKKRVTIQRMTTYDRDVASAKSVSVYRFVYDANGCLDSVSKNMEFSSKRKYNKKGKIIEDVYTNIVGKYTVRKKQIYAYKDTFMISNTSLNDRNDTIQIVQYRYSNKKQVEEKEYSLRSGERKLTDHQEYFYDKSGNIQKVKYYKVDPESGNKEVNYKIELFTLY